MKFYKCRYNTCACRKDLLVFDTVGERDGVINYISNHVHDYFATTYREQNGEIVAILYYYDCIDGHSRYIAIDKTRYKYIKSDYEQATYVELSANLFREIHRGFHSSETF